MILKKVFKNNTNEKGMSLLIVMMIIAVFSVLILGTYTILNRHIIRTTETKDGQGAYYAAEGVLRLISTDIDKRAEAIAIAANEANEDLSAEEFTTRLNASLATWTDTEIKNLARSAYSFSEVVSASIAPVSVTTENYTCCYKLTAVMDCNDNVRKKVSGIYGVVFLSSSSEIASYNKMIIDENSPMLVALEDVDADSVSSLNGKVELRGSFSYPDHYPYLDNPEMYINEDIVYKVDNTSLAGANVRIPNIPQPPTSEIYTEPQWHVRTPTELLDTSIFSQNTTIEVPYNPNLWTTRKYREYSKINIRNFASGINNGKLTVNINQDDCYILTRDMEWDNDVTLNVNGKNFVFYIDRELNMQNGAKLHVNLNDNDVFIVINSYVSSTSSLGMYTPNQIQVTTTGTGTLYIFIKEYEQYNLNSFTADFTNESNVSVVFLCDFYTGTQYKEVIFNANTPSGKKKAGDLNVFVSDDDAESHFTVNRNSKLRFNTAEGTKLSVIADHVNILGQMEIGGNATLNLYARKDCTVSGDPSNPNNNLSNFTFNDAGMTDEEKAKKIVDTKFNIYYYGTEPFSVSDYKCCSNFYMADFADINITNTTFYGNIYSAARDPENGETRKKISFTDSYLSCGAIYAPRMDIDLYGDGSKRYADKFQTNEGRYAACVFACITGTNVSFSDNVIVKTSTVTSENLELEIEMEYTSGVVSDGSSFEKSHFYRGFKEE